MTTNDIIYIGIKDSVAAFERTTGNELWRTKLPSASGVVIILCDGRNIFAGSAGKFYCLDLKGTLLWKNDLPGLGYGLMCMALPNGLSAPDIALLQAVVSQQAAAAAAGTTAH